ncbi:MAG: hypothetical protein AB7P76_12640 [Candidatus Melainabacteria bacterium]
MPDKAAAAGYQPYIDALENSVRTGALRWLHQIDLDPASRTYGVADREFWAWKTRDFINHTWQAGLAGFLDATPYLELSCEEIRAVVRAVVTGTQRFQRRNGSFEEAYPWESSYCVTALVLFSLLAARSRHPEAFPEDSDTGFHTIVRNGLTFLEATSETHGVIANHLATGYAAIALARQYLNLPLDEDRHWRPFMALQHAEGWFPEYGGADPGYQTLLNHYLRVYLACRPSGACPQLRESLERSQRFCAAFAMPDGGFAGEAGSRGTQIVYPGGLLPLNDDPDAMPGWWLSVHQPNIATVTPVTVEAGNMAPVFNSWAFLAVGLKQTRPDFSEVATLLVSDQVFPEAGLWVFRREHAMAVVSTKQAVIRRVQRVENVWQDASLTAWVKTEQNNQLTTQGVPPQDLTVTESSIRWRYAARQRRQPINTPLRLIALRVIGMVCALLPWLQSPIKQAMVAFVMGRSEAVQPLPLTMTLDRQDALLTVVVDPVPPGWRRQPVGFHQHMASANTLDLRALKDQVL